MMKKTDLHKKHLKRSELGIYKFRKYHIDQKKRYIEQSKMN